MWNIFGAVIALSILITVHEFGHYLVARLFGVEIEIFSIGFGRKLISFRKNQTEFRISMIPLGGYVKMKGENPEEDLIDEENSFRTRKWWQRALIAFAGPFMNLIFACLLFILSFAIGRNYEDLYPVVGEVDKTYSHLLQPEDTILKINDQQIVGWSQIIQYVSENEENKLQIKRADSFLSIELPPLPAQFWYEEIKPYVPAEVGEVTPGMPAFRAGLMNGDKILAVNDLPVNNWYEMRELIGNNQDDDIELTVERDGREFVLILNLEKNIYQDNKVIGITMPSPVKISENYSLAESIRFGSVSTINFVFLNYAMLVKLISQPSELKSNIGGPVMLYTMSRQAAGKGWDVIILFIASISIILMIMNLLPIPVLDGGHIIFCFLEGIFGKPIPLKLQIILQNIGVFILIFLMVFAFWNDIGRVFSRSVAIRQQTTEFR
jgi:regulator of sigma E protease